jgi:hypothetical protein
MQDNILTLAVDELNDTNTTDHVYERNRTYENRSLFHEAGHTLVARDTLALYRTEPKVNGNFKGTAKCAMKFSADKSVTGVDGLAALTSPIIGEVSFSVPVGITSADKLIMRQRIIALLDDDTIMDALMDQQSI